MKILIVEDEEEILNSTAQSLELLGYVVDKATDGETAEEMCFVENYDLMVLDVNLPKMSGFEVLRTVREYNKDLKIIMLTARANIEDRIYGLDMGANDYLIKPFHFGELHARIRALLRRKYIQESNIIEVGSLKFDTKKRLAYVEDRNIKLTGKETGILEYLLLNRGRYVSQDEILEHVWGDELDIFSNTVRVHMAALRRKIKNELSENIITNVIGKGYIIDENR